jgi:hypothetical protein
LRVVLAFFEQAVNLVDHSMVVRLVDSLTLLLNLCATVLSHLGRQQNEKLSRQVKRQARKEYERELLRVSESVQGKIK